MLQLTMPQPSLSANEIELYRLLEHANLSQYFTNFLSKGGDDVSQLAKANKEEFDEIIELVGMIQKPLHIRRLQKALKDWLDRPSIILNINSEIVVPQSATSYLLVNQNLVPTIKSECVKFEDTHTEMNNIFMSQPLLPFPDNEPDTNYIARMKNLPSLFNGSAFNSNNNGRGMQLDVSNGIPVSMLPNAVLSIYEKNKIRLAAENLAQTLPAIEVRSSSTGRKDVNKRLLNILSMSKDDPNRENQIYNYSAIYGRFNAPRRTGKPMNHHEVSVNEAAAQLSLQIPELITQRDNLFHLARQVVKMAEEIQSNAFAVPNQSNEGQMIIENHQLIEMEKQITDIKNKIEFLLQQESSIRESYKEAKLNNDGMRMKDLQKDLDDTIHQLNFKFTEQTSLATKRMLITAGSLLCDDTKMVELGTIKLESTHSPIVNISYKVPAIQFKEDIGNYEYQ